jgi:hypothetical protein
MANDWTYQRTGWNKRGPSNAYYLQLAKDQSEMLQNPDSNHWKKKALEMRDWLVKKMGGDEFEAWADRLFPEDTIDQATWKEVYELYEAHYKLLLDECSCKPDLPDGRCFPLCDVCKAQIDKHYGKKIPY